MWNQTGLSDYRTTRFTNLNLSNLVQHWNTNMVKKWNMGEKWTHVPPVSPQNYTWTIKKSFNKAVIKHFCKISKICKISRILKIKEIST